MATKKLRYQVFDNLKELIWALLAMGISIYGGIQVLLNGSGNRSKPENTVKGLLKKFLYWLEDMGYGNLVVGILLAMFSVIAITCLCLTIYHLSYLTPKRSVLGRSILAQAFQYEVFEELVQAIDTDLSLESKRFGTELVAGTQWLLSEQSMQIAKIERIYMGERKIEKKKHAILLVADGDGNVMETVFSRYEDRDKAAQYLQKHIPELYMGNLTELE